MATEEELNTWMAAAKDVARKAGAIIKQGFNDGRAQSTACWKATADLVTDVDKQVERLVFDTLRAQFPDHKFIGEETTGATEVIDENHPTWCVDPIDGTTNFVHHYPQTCISIALFVKKQVVVAVVFNPILDEMFTAIRGHGAFLNETQRIHVSASKSLKEAVISTNVGTMRHEKGINFITGNIANLLAHEVLSVRMTGSAAISLSSVACGRLCAFYEWGIHIWDIAAGVLLVEEAGGVVVAPDGGPLDLSTQRVIAGTPAVIKELVPLLLPKDF